MIKRKGYKIKEVKEIAENKVNEKRKRKMMIFFCERREKNKDKEIKK